MGNVGRFLLRGLLVPLGGAAAITVAMAVVLVVHRTFANATQEEWLEAGIFAGFAFAERLAFWIGLTAVAGGVGALIAEAFAIRRTSRGIAS
jgi:hypothetical protein